MTEAPDHLPAIPGAVRLGAVLDQQQMMPGCNVRQRIHHVGRELVSVNRQQCPRARGDRRFGGERIHGICRRVDVDQDRLHARLFDGAHGRHRRM